MGTRERVAAAVALVAFSVAAGMWISLAAERFEADAVLSLCAGALVTELWVGTIAVAVALFAARPLRSSLGMLPGRLSARETGVLVLGTLAGSHALDGWLELSGLVHESVLGELPRTLEGIRGLRLVLAMIALGIAPGIAEELLCRGLIQRAMTRRAGPLAGILVSSLLFGALHIEPIHAGFAALLGLYLGAAAHWSGSTRTPMLCHAVNNLSAVLLAAGAAGTFATPLSTLGAAALALLCLGHVARVASRGAREPLSPLGPS